jgi:peroxiredoxin
MSVKVDTGCSEFPPSESEARPDVSSSRQAPPLRQRMAEAEEAQRVVTRLTGQSLPPVDLATPNGVVLPLLAHVEGRVALYMVPGSDQYGPDGQLTDDAIQHYAYARHQTAFRVRRIKMIGLSSQSQKALERVPHTHLLLSDPDRRLASALRLPTVDLGERVGYDRLTLVTNNGRIEKVFYRVPDPSANVSQVITWMKVAGWWQQDG